MIKLKLSSFLMKQKPSISGKLKRKQKQKQKRKGIMGSNTNTCANNQTHGDDADTNNFPDELLLHILSHMSLKEAVRTSVLARRWKYLWRSVFGTLQFDFVTANGDSMEVEKFVSLVNTVLGLHQGRHVKGLVVMFEEKYVEPDETSPETCEICRAIDSWVYFAVQKEVERFELCFSTYHSHEFPSIEMLKLQNSSPFRHVRVVRLDDVWIKDEVVHYLLASCPNLKELYIWYSDHTKNLRIVDPPSLKVLELRNRNLQSVEISSKSLVSLALTGYGGSCLLLTSGVPNLREFTIGNHYFLDFISEPNSSFSDQLVKLAVVVEMMIFHKPLLCLPDPLPRFSSLKRLEVTYRSVVGRSLLFFTCLIKASPQLCEFRIQMRYSTDGWTKDCKLMPLPAITDAEAAKFNHTSLKVVEMCGYVGCPSEEQLMVKLLNNGASSIERVVINTESDYYDDAEAAYCIASRQGFRYLDGLPELGAVTRSESIERAKLFVSSITFPSSHVIKFIVM